MSSCAALSLADAMRAVYGKHMLPDHLRIGERERGGERILSHASLLVVYFLFSYYIHALVPGAGILI